MAVSNKEQTRCLGVPMRIIEINGYEARCEARGIERKASLFLLQHEDLQVGDLVMIHVGNAIQKMTEEDAQTAWDLFDEILERESAMERQSIVGAGLTGDTEDRADSPVGAGLTGDTPTG